MMERTTLSRRAWLCDAARLGMFSAASVTWLGCKGRRLVCDDTRGLNTATKRLRATLEYQDVSPVGDTRNCANCQFFRAAPKEDQCGACLLFLGPINPSGFCNSWAPLES